MCRVEDECSVYTQDEATIPWDFPPGSIFTSDPNTTATDGGGLAQETDENSASGSDSSSQDESGLGSDDGGKRSRDGVDADGEKSGDAEVIDVDFELVRPHRPAAPPPRRPLALPPFQLLATFCQERPSTSQ